MFFSFMKQYPQNLNSCCKVNDEEYKANNLLSRHVFQGGGELQQEVHSPTLLARYLNKDILLRKQKKRKEK